MNTIQTIILIIIAVLFFIFGTFTYIIFPKDYRSTQPTIIPTAYEQIIDISTIKNTTCTLYKNGNTGKETTICTKNN